MGEMPALQAGEGPGLCRLALPEERAQCQVLRG